MYYITIAIIRWAGVGVPHSPPSVASRGPRLPGPSNRHLAGPVPEAGGDEGQEATRPLENHTSCNGFTASSIHCSFNLFTRFAGISRYLSDSLYFLSFWQMFCICPRIFPDFSVFSCTSHIFRLKPSEHVEHTETEIAVNLLHEYRESTRFADARNLANF